MKMILEQYTDGYSNELSRQCLISFERKTLHRLPKDIEKRRGTQSPVEYVFEKGWERDDIMQCEKCQRLYKRKALKLHLTEAKIKTHLTNIN